MADRATIATSLEPLADAAMRLLRADVCRVWLVDLRDGAIVPRVVRWRDQSALLRVDKSTADELALTVAHQAALDRKVVTDVDLADGRSWDNGVGMRFASIAAPVIVECQSLIGVLDALCIEPRRWLDDDRRAIAVLAELVGRTCRRRALSRDEHDACRPVRFHEACAEVGREHDVEHLLRLIVAHARDLLAADMANIRLLDEEHRELQLRSFVGADERTPLPAVNLDHSLTGLAVRTGVPVVSDDLAADPRRSRWGLPGVDADDIRSFVVAPMLAGHRVIGVLGVGKRTLTHFAPEQVSLLAAFSEKAAAALEQAEVCQSRERTVARLQETVERLSAELKMLRGAIEVRDHFSKMLLEGHTANDIAARLSLLIQNPVEIEESSNRMPVVPNRARVTAEDDPATGARHPVLAGPAVANLRTAPPGDRAVQRRLMKLPEGSGREIGQVVVPIWADNDRMGYLIATESNRRLDQSDVVAMEQAATAVGLDFLKRRYAGEAARELRRDFLKELVRGGDDHALILHRADTLGFDLAKPTRVMVIGLAGCAAGQESEEMARRLFGIVCTGFTQHALVGVGTIDDHVVLLCPSSHDEAGASRGSAALALANRIKEQILREVPQIGVCIGIGRMCIQPADYRLSYREALKALNLVRTLGQADRTVLFEQLGAEYLLYEGYEAGKLRQFVDDTLSSLIEEDRRHGSRLLLTLAKYLENNCNLRKTARELYLHVSTLRYRLERCEEVAHLNLDDCNTRFNLQLALRAARLAGLCQF